MFTNASRALRPLTIVALLVGLAACGSDAKSTSTTSTVPLVTTIDSTGPMESTTTTMFVTPTAPNTQVTVAPTTVPPVTLASTTVPVATDPPATDAPTTVEVATTVAPVVLVAPEDTCSLMSTQEVAVAFGGDAQNPIRSANADGTATTCTWKLDADESEQFVLTVVAGVVTDDSTGWPAAPVTVDGLGEQSFVVTDGDVRIGFVRGGLTVTATVLTGPASTVETWIDAARVIDARLQGLAPLPA